MFEIYPGAPKEVNGVRLEDLEQATSFAKRLELCKPLRRLGAGSSRRVFEWTPRYVLKVAKNRRGVAQNQVEGDYFINKNYGEIIARVFISSDEDYFLVSERAKWITEDRFKQLVGIPFQYYIRLLGSDYQFEPLSEEDRKELPDKAEEFIDQVQDLGVTLDLVPSDLQRIDSYGAISGRVVIVDFGFSNWVLDEHYQR